MPDSAHVSTFYSFKGGVGRSLLLANVGWWLAERGKVLLWDLDIEAPGLHRIPALRPPTVAKGFLDWLHERAGEKALSEEAGKQLRRLVLPVPGRPNLEILPAFGDRSDFGRMYAEGPWRRLLVEEPAAGLELFDAVLAILCEGRKHLLIDSRTGITDIGGLLSAYLPHLTVLVASYGQQSLQGFTYVRKALERAATDQLAVRHRLGAASRLELLHVLSPVPADSEEAEPRRAVWRREWPNLDPIEIPFDPRLLWSEHLLAAEDAESKTGRAYREVSSRIAAARDAFLALTEEVELVAARFPEERGSSDHPSDRTVRGWTFERRVERLLSLHGYTVEPEQLLGGNRVDLVARLATGLEEQCWWVECKDHRQAIPKKVLSELAEWLDTDDGRRQRARGMVVARSFSPAAVTFASQRADIKIWTVDELERRLFDARPYLTSLVRSFESSPLARTYVSQRVLLENRPPEEAAVALLPHAVSWAGGEGTRLWLLLGDYGTGKSVFFKRLGYELAKAALENPEAPFPIAIDLKEFPNATSAETLFFEHLKRYAPDFRGNPEVLRHLLSAGRAVLLLDGFDEMGVAAAGRSVEEQFRELARLAGEEPLEPKRGNRVLVTCRTHFFRDQQQVKDAATGKLEGFVPQASEDSALGRLARRFDARIDELQVFDDEQIAMFLALHLGPSEVARAQKTIQETYDLKTLAPRPVLLEMIVTSLPILWNEKGGEAITPAGLYERYTRLWLEDKSGRNLQTPPPLRHRLLQVLATALWRRPERQLHHRELLAEVERLAPLFPGLDYTRVDVELRTAAFLVRSAEGFYRFSHKSFLEYFLAGYLWGEVGEGLEHAGPALELPPLTPEVGKFFWELTAEGREERLAALRAVLQAPYRVGASENALRLGGWSYSVTKQYFRVERAQLPGVELRGDLGYVDLPEADLTGCDLRGAVFGGTRFQSARLAGARLGQAMLAGADFSLADLIGADLSGAVLSGTIFLGAKLAGACMADAQLDNAKFEDAELREADFSGAHGRFVNFENAQLDGARLAETVFAESSLRRAALGGTDTNGWLRGPQDSALAESLVRPIPRHSSWFSIRALSISPNGRWLASAGKSGEILIRDLRSGTVRRQLCGHSGRVLALAWSGEGRRLASAGSDAVVRVWESASGRLERELSGHAGSVLALAWSREGRRLASAGNDGRIRIWDVETGRLVAELSTLDSGLGLVAIPGGSYSTWHPDGTPAGPLPPRAAQIEIPLPNGARYLPLGPLAEELYNPEKVREALGVFGSGAETKPKG